jgi:imidazolonepropionase-like amidohydrolase
VFANVTVLDPASGQAFPGMSVTVDGTRITAVAPQDSAPTPPGSRVVDGRGKYLLPGFWDMHVHGTLDRTFTLPMLVAHGVTGVREMFGRRLDRVKELRQEIAAGRALGPTIVTSGPIVDGAGAFWPGSAIVTTGPEAKAAVRAQAAAGADFIKVYSALNGEAYRAIAEQARTTGIPFVGHVPDLVSLREASAAGQASVEHLTGLLLAGASDEDGILAELADSARGPGGRKAVQRALGRLRPALAERFDTLRAESTFALLAANRTWQVPTLTVALVGADPTNPALTTDPRLELVPHLLAGMWGAVRRFAGSDTSSARRAVNQRIYQIQRWAVGAMSRRGVPLLAGTDTPNPYTIPGPSLHHELQLLVEAGLSPVEAVRAATSAPAEFLGARDSLGSVAPGKVADLVLLGANPFEDIGNSRLVEAVVLRGRLLDRGSLDALLEGVRAARWRPSDAGLTLLGAMAAMVPLPVRIGLIVLILSIPTALLVWRARRKRKPA